MKNADDLQNQAMRVLGTHKHAEVQCLLDLKCQLWGRIDGAIDTEKEKASITEKQISGALKSAIDAHGPITNENKSSATKRIIGLIK